MVFTIKYRVFQLKFSHHPILCDNMKTLENSISIMIFPKKKHGLANVTPSSTICCYNVVPPSYGWFLNPIIPHSLVRYIYHKP